jgi:UDP-2,4-diacetamido-2,4,6-trideoxy-beta-L-altropyranose hydrolase
MRVAFRVDASSEIGVGHFKRCLSLAHALRAAGADVDFVMRDLGIDPAAELAAAGCALHRLPFVSAEAVRVHAPGSTPHARWARVEPMLDASQTAQALQLVAVGHVVVDHYAFDACWHRQVANALGASVVAVDDLADRALDVRVLIDHNLADDHRVKYAGRLPADCTVLGGPRFALLGPAYAAADAFEVRDSVRSLGIFMGGSDPHDLSSTVIEACREHAGFSGPIEVVSTSANPQLARLRSTASRWSDVELSVDLPDLRDFFARHDLQVGAGGGASWERCCVGAPAVVLVTADNQRAVVPQLVALGAVATVPEAEVTSPAVLGQTIAALVADSTRRRELSARARSLVDGRGAQRVALRLLAAGLLLRPARLDDAALLHVWRNHPATRAVSRDVKSIDFEAHVAWLRRTLADTGRRLWIGRVGNLDVGAIRFDALGDGDAEVSLYLDPALHGLGLGSRLLRVGEAEAQHSGLACRRFVATVLVGNAGSCQLFVAGGYSVATSAGSQVATMASYGTGLQAGQSLWTKPVTAVLQTTPQERVQP